MFQRVGPKAFKKDLGNIKKLDAYLDHPHRSFKSIHLAGTNGKGSTSFFIASLLAEMGYKVGLYTSPHYKDYRERIKVDGKMIDKSYVKRFVNQLIEDGIFNSELKPSFFEISVAMGFNYFRDQKVDFAVIETGLGGRLDSTNIITPQISIITNIGMDHTNFLGNTLKKIAKEKAGIIKKKIPVVVGRKQKETHPVFQKVATSKSTKLTYCRAVHPSIPQSLLKNFPAYQKENLTTAITSVIKMKLNPSEKQIKKAWTKGLKSWGYMGRFMRIDKKPTIIFDSAHNVDGISVLFKELSKEKYDQLHIILAMVGDKDQSKVLSLFPKDAHYYFSQAKIPRAMKKEDLKSKASSFGLEGKAYSSVARALATSKKKAGPRDLVLVAGSIFTVAEVL